VAWSPDGKWLASGGSDGTVILWDTASWHQLRKLAGHELWVNSVAWSPDGARFASGSGNGTVRVWDTSTLIAAQSP